MEQTDSNQGALHAIQTGRQVMKAATFFLPLLYLHASLLTQGFSLFYLVEIVTATVDPKAF